MARLLHVGVFHHKLMCPYFGRRVLILPNISNFLNPIIFITFLNYEIKLLEFNYFV